MNRDSEATRPLRMSEAARRLGLPSRELAQLVYDGALRHVMVDGIAHVPEDAIADYQAIRPA